jgi:PAS domain S-box-containing protein
MPKILIADDEWVTRVEIEEMLTDLGYEVVGQVETGAEAIEMVRRLEPDLIIMDVMMLGEMNGIDAARVIKAEWGTPIVFVTGYGDPEYIEAAKEIAPFGYVMKPFDEKEIHAFVEIALSKRELELKLMKAHEGLERANLILQEEIETRKKTEKELRESEKLYRDIFEKNKAMKWVLDPATGKIIDANSAACEFYQYSYEEMTKLYLWDINLLSEAEIKKHLASAESDEKTEYTSRHRLASGEIRTVQVYTGTVVSGGKRLLHSIIIDITDRQRAEKALRESEERYRRLTENAKDMIYRMSLPDGIYEYVSPASIDLTGYTPEEFYESPMIIQKHIYPDWVEYLQEQWANLVDGKVAPFYEYKVIHKSGDERWVNQRNVLILDNNGQPQAIEGIATDITERKRAEESLREKEEMLQTITDSALDSIFCKNMNRQYTFVNPAMLQLMGCTNADLLGKSP